MIPSEFYLVLSFAIASLSAILDLLQTFTGSTLRRASGWTTVYAIFAGLVGLLVFAMLAGVEVSVGSFAATPLIKAVVSGLLFKPLIQSRLFMLKTKELDEPTYGPAATYEKLSNTIKKQISLASVAANVEIISSYLTADISDLRGKVISVIYAHEMWSEDEKRNQIANLDSDLVLLSSNEAKKLRLAQFLHQYGSSTLDLIERFRKKINSLSEPQLREIAERMLKTISDVAKRNYFRQQLDEPSVRIQTIRKLVLRNCSDPKLMEDVLSNRLH